MGGVREGQHAASGLGTWRRRRVVVVWEGGRGAVPCFPGLGPRRRGRGPDCGMWACGCGASRLDGADWGNLRFREGCGRLGSRDPVAYSHPLLVVTRQICTARTHMPRSRTTGLDHGGARVPSRNRARCVSVPVPTGSVIAWGLFGRTGNERDNGPFPRVMWALGIFPCPAQRRVVCRCSADRKNGPNPLFTNAYHLSTSRAAGGWLSPSSRS